MVAKATKNVLTITDPNDFIFHSDYNTLKILASGTYSPTVSDTGGAESYVSISHGQSFIPIVEAFCKFETGRVGPVGARDNNEYFFFSRLVVTASEIRFYYINDTGSSYSPVFKYDLFEAPL